MFRDKIRAELFLEKSKSVLKGVSVELVIEQRKKKRCNMKRYYIVRLDGVDWAVTEDSEKINETVNYLRQYCEECKTEFNVLTTIYNFTIRN